MMRIWGQLLSKNLPSTFHLTFCLQLWGNVLFRKQTPEHCYLYTFQRIPRLWDQIPPGTQAYTLRLNSTYFLRTFSNILHLIFKRRIYVMQGRHYSFHFAFRLRQGVYYYSLERSATVTQGPSLPATSHLWFKSSDWSTWRQEIWRLNSSCI